jgi:hypothetical protein
MAMGALNEIYFPPDHVGADHFSAVTFASLTVFILVLCITGAHGELNAHNCVVR